MKRNLIILIISIGLVFGFLLLNNDQKDDKKVSTVAFISLSEVDQNTFNGFKSKMKEYSWEEGKNLNYIISKPAGKISNLKPIVSSVIEKKPDLILVSSTPATQEVKRATEKNNIPVVFCPVNDPKASNIVLNLKNPEKNITGVRLPIGDLKRFEWLYVIAPNVKNVLIPYTKNDDSSRLSRENVKKAAAELGINIVEKSFLESGSIEEFFSSIPSEVDSIFLPRDSNVEVKIDEFVKYTNSKKIPLCVPSYQQVEKGALFTFGFIHYELGRDAARMADRILKGVKTHDLPVKIGSAHLVVNEKTANNIGIELSTKVIRNAYKIIKE